MITRRALIPYKARYKYYKREAEYTEVDFTTSGSFTFTVPTGVTKLRLALVGGGGSATVVSGDNGDTYSYGYPTASRFGSYATSTSKINRTTNESPKGYALGFDSALGSGAYGKGAPSVGDYNGFTGNTYNGYIDVVSGQTYNIVVGAAGLSATSGFVKIAYGGDINLTETNRNDYDYKELI